MRIIGQCNLAFDMMCERAASRHTKGKPLGNLQMVQDTIAESAVEIETARLLTLKAAWTMDERGGHGSQSRMEIAMLKFHVPRILLGILDRAIQLHGAMGYTTELPLEYMYRSARALRIADGADEVHKQTVARQILKSVNAVEELPSQHIPTRRKQAWEKFGHLVEAAKG